MYLTIAIIVIVAVIVVKLPRRDRMTDGMTDEEREAFSARKAKRRRGGWK
jgi:hypothetical protein